MADEHAAMRSATLQVRHSHDYKTPHIYDTNLLNDNVFRSFLCNLCYLALHELPNILKGYIINSVCVISLFV